MLLNHPTHKPQRNKLIANRYKESQFINETLTVYSQDGKTSYEIDSPSKVEHDVNVMVINQELDSEMLNVESVIENNIPLKPVNFDMSSSAPENLPISVKNVSSFFNAPKPQPTPEPTPEPTPQPTPEPTK